MKAINKLIEETEKHECSDITHKEFYRYCCKKCYHICSKQKERLPSGNWCDCICNHNIYTCIKCWKPVKKIGGFYYFVNENHK